MKNFKKNFWILGTVAFGIIFIASAVIFQIYEFGTLPAQFYGALIGVVITAIITVFLLKGQTSSEEEREKSVSVFGRKQDVYTAFLDRLKGIVQDGRISIPTGGDTTADRGTDDLKELIFQLGYVQMHASAPAMNAVIDGVARIVRLMNDFRIEPGSDAGVDLTEYYASLSEELFRLIAVLKQDLYGQQSQPADKSRMNAILRECDLFVEG